MSRSVLVLTALALTAGVLGTSQNQSHRLRVVDSLDLGRYAGKWFEIARLPNKSQVHCAGDVVVRYSLRTDGRIDVLNQCRRADGRSHETRAIARKAGRGTNNATLQFRSGPALLSFLPVAWDDYWIIGLGSDYTWAVVGAPDRARFWILSRAPQLSALAYSQAFEIGRGNGFDVGRVVKTEHTN
jgi:apolipoprotein D and lipocalin family protein